MACGDTITADTTLDSDLTDCPNNGIVIGADDITAAPAGVIDGGGNTARDNGDARQCTHVSCR